MNEKDDLFVQARKVAKEELQSYAHLSRIIYNLENEMKLVDDELTGKAIDYSKDRIKNGTYVEDVYIHVLSKKEDIAKKIEDIKHKKEIIKATIENMNTRYRKLIVKRYVQNLSIRKISIAEGFSEPHMYRILDSALKQYVYLRFGITDEKKQFNFNAGVIDFDLDLDLDLET